MAKTNLVKALARWETCSASMILCGGNFHHLLEKLCMCECVHDYCIYVTKGFYTLVQYTNVYNIYSIYVDVDINNLMNPSFA